MSDWRRAAGFRKYGVTLGLCKNVCDMYAMGSTQSQIAENTGLNVHTVNRIVNMFYRGEIYADSETDAIIYTGVAEYIERNEMTCSEFAKKCGMPKTQFMRAMSERPKNGPSKRVIDRVLFGSRMTYERAFGRVRESGGSDADQQGGFGESGSGAEDYGAGS